jgi:hypothetical protein
MYELWHGRRYALVDLPILLDTGRKVRLWSDSLDARHQESTRPRMATTLARAAEARAGTS